MDRSAKRREFLSQTGKAACAVAAVAGLAATGRNAGAAPMGKKAKAAPVSACGLYCGACPLYASQQCQGCASDKRAEHCQNCAIRACAESKGVKNCGLCAGFPCKKTAAFVEKKGAMGQVAERNSAMIKAGGLSPMWPRKQQARWTCPKCGAAFSIKDEKCPKCGMNIYSGAEEAADYVKHKSA